MKNLVNYTKSVNMQTKEKEKNGAYNEKEVAPSHVYKV